MRHSSKRQAFTLIEVLLVVTIMAILTVSGLRGLINVQRSARVNDAYDRFMSFIDLSRSYALNGKQVNCDGQGNMCVPAIFGVMVVTAGSADKFCPTGAQEVFQFFLPDNKSSINDAWKYVLDTYCVNKNAKIVSSVAAYTFMYDTPFGIFSAQNYDPASTTPIIIDFCDGSTCTNTALKKSITLYSNVGVPE